MRLRRARARWRYFVADHVPQNAENSLAQVLPVVEQVNGARAIREQVYEERLVCLCGVAAFARQHQVVAPVVGRLTFPRRDVIECERARCVRVAAIRAHWSVCRQQPLSSFGVSVAAGRNRRMFWGSTLWRASALFSARALGSKWHLIQNNRPEASSHRPQARGLCPRDSSEGNPVRLS